MDVIAVIDAYSGLSCGLTGNWDDASWATVVILAEETGSARIQQDVEGWWAVRSGPGG